VKPDRLVLFAAGSGITPMIQIMQRIGDLPPPYLPVHLILSLKATSQLPNVGVAALCEKIGAKMHVFITGEAIEPSPPDRFIGRISTPAVAPLLPAVWNWDDRCTCLRIVVTLVREQAVLRRCCVRCLCSRRKTPWWLGVVLKAGPKRLTPFVEACTFWPPTLLLLTCRHGVARRRVLTFHVHCAFLHVGNRKQKNDETKRETRQLGQKTHYFFPIHDAQNVLRSFRLQQQLPVSFPEHARAGE
jgi:hypothetical protein